jgi:hypothetical protein
MVPSAQESNSLLFLISLIITIYIRIKMRLVIHIKFQRFQTQTWCFLTEMTRFPLNLMNSRLQLLCSGYDVKNDAKKCVRTYHRCKTVKLCRPSNGKWFLQITPNFINSKLLSQLSTDINIIVIPNILINREQSFSEGKVLFLFGRFYVVTSFHLFSCPLHSLKLQSRLEKYLLANHV